DSQYYMDLAKAIGLKKEINNTKMELFPSKKDIAYANNFIKKNRIMGAIIGIAPGGASNPGQTVPLKRWPKKRYSELCNMILKKTKANIIFFGGKSDENIIRDIMNEIKIGSTNQNQIFNTVGKNTILQSAAMIKKCKVFISNDSGPMHIAAAVDTNTISIFGPTNPIKLAPLGKKHKYLWAKIKCAPCYKNGKFPKCSVKKCMNSIEEYVVFNEIKRKIKK
ncbi:MAG: glycosyltransferase family 9 protein, partial [Nanoarchaeota archaeon]|nr:glycosyltransferase family 9 protein [Nanoarchaeota archaeon]